jgi:hypothetical protein
MEPKSWWSIPGASPWYFKAPGVTVAANGAFYADQAHAVFVWAIVLRSQVGGPRRTLWQYETGYGGRGWLPTNFSSAGFGGNF